MAVIAEKKSILEYAMGAIAESVDYELNRVLANIGDPNTVPTAKRKITLTLVFSPDENRVRIEMASSVKSTLAPLSTVKTMLGVTRARNGDLLLAEMLPQVPGQVDMDGDEAPAPAGMIFGGGSGFNKF